ncbi:DUF986 family protein [Cronobacter sakazakii]|uniref:DUF986 family protein n=1 Tax=Cronobacter sakazakii TaxID=28141 RepID=UPI00029BECFF|nr:DUF986 family protein [Cronobacter sakazakii]CCK07379.1 FIG00554165: hypothetical protein [Cronobacter sakazakii 696]ELY2550336.1 DUF986 domain-containing protein [Cronobacter sakazakii]ELY6001335.1 DUF986 domain-containing protein [Cronobacter sakazakii]ELY6404290.1 DUF986 domain-containing protein [Cronobacter sakazakii]MBF4814125.1 DUF986 domain-containing protein [Cronobacter sakazakii]
MTLTDGVLVIFILALLGWAIYDQWGTERRHGKTLLRVPLLKRGRADSLIFTGLVAILIWQNVASHGALLTTWLLGALGLLAIYLFWIREPQIRFKREGFFFAGGWVKYNHIKAMNLSEDGVLVMQLDKRRLLIRVKNIDDLERIYHFMVNNQ